MRFSGLVGGRRGRMFCVTAASIGLVSCPLCALAHMDLHDRIEDVSMTLLAAPGRADLWLQRAELRRQHGESASALADVAEALRLDPDWSAAYLQRARILLDEHRFVAARAAADGCLARDPGNSQAFVIRSRCSAQLGETNAAIHDLSMALKGKPQSLPDLYLERSRLQAAQGLWKDAVTGLDEGMARLGKTPSLAIPALEYEQQAGELEAALARLETLQRLMTRERYLALKATLLTGIDNCTTPTAAPIPIPTCSR